MKKLICLAAVLFFAFGVAAEAADEWGIDHENKARFIFVINTPFIGCFGGNAKGKKENGG